MFPRMAKFWASTKLKVNVQKTNNPNTRLHCTKPKSLGKKRYLDKLWNLSTFNTMATSHHLHFVNYNMSKK
jgi:hypothetical protein